MLVDTLVSSYACRIASSPVAHPTSFTFMPPFDSLALSCLLTKAHTMTCDETPFGTGSDVSGIIMCFVDGSPRTADTITDTAVFPLAVSSMYGVVFFDLTASLPLLHSFSSIAAPITANLLELSVTANLGGSTSDAASTSDLGTLTLLTGPGRTGLPRFTRTPPRTREAGCTLLPPCC